MLFKINILAKKIKLIFKRVYTERELKSITDTLYKCKTNNIGFNLSVCENNTYNKLSYHIELDVCEFVLVIEHSLQNNKSVTSIGITDINVNVAYDIFEFNKSFNEFTNELEKNLELIYSYFEALRGNSK